MPGVVEVNGEAPVALILRGFSDGQFFSLTRQDGERFFGEASVENAAWAAYTRLKVVGLNATDGIEDLVSGARFVPRSPEAFTCDADGNLLSGGRWSYTWDAENRLIQMETRPGAISAGAPRERLLFSYDSGSRRFRKEVQRWNRDIFDLRYQPSASFCLRRMEPPGGTQRIQPCSGATLSVGHGPN